MVAHVDFKLLTGPLPFPTVVGVAQTEILFRSGQADSAPGEQFQIQEAEESASEVGKVRDSSLGRLKCRDQHDENQNAHQVLRLDRHWNRKQEQFTISVEHAERD